MLDESLALMYNIISDFLEIKNLMMSNNLAYNKKLLSDFLKNQTQHNSMFIDLSRLSIDRIELLSKNSEILNRQTSCDFNVLSMFDIGETKHSYLLAHFLNPQGNHGQKHLFLNLFLDMIGIERLNNNENWIVSAEVGRIDVLLKRTHPHSVVVIENKSNYAVDQEHQLYRYWYQEIYTTICNRSLSKDYILNPPKSYYQLIYLSPDNLKIPSTNSLTKPLFGYENLDLPNVVPIETNILLFNVFIVEWLKKSLDLIPKNNHRIREYIKQYIEYWN